MADGGQRVLITGIAGELAGRLARLLEDDDRIEHIVGVDLQEPRHDLERTEFVRADLRNPLVARTLDSTRVDTLVHLSITAVPRLAGGRARMKEHNVIGTMQLLAAAQKAEKLRKVITKSTTAVYGSGHRDPVLFREDMEPDESGRSGYAKDAVEVEGYARAFGRRRPDVALTILRFANFIGPRVDSPLARYFQLPVIPTVLGFDPRMQFCHESDAVEVLRRVVEGEHPGIYNVAGPGIVYLSQAVRLAGKVSLPVPSPFAQFVASGVRRTGRVDFSPEQMRFLLFGRVGDITRLRTSIGYEPEFSTRAAFSDFVEAKQLAGFIDRDRAIRAERRLFELLTRKDHDTLAASRSR